MNRIINCKVLIKFLTIGILSFGVTVSATGQVTVDKIRNAVNSSLTGSPSQQTQQALNSLDAHRNNRCSSGRIYVVRLYWNYGKQLAGTAYYCENEESQLNSVRSVIPEQGPNFSIKIEIINQKSVAEVEADNQAAIEQQKEIERQREAEHLEKQRLFDKGKKELVDNLIGMSQEVTKPLELMGGAKESTKPLELIGMNQEPSKPLELIGSNTPSTKASVTVSPRQWAMTPDQLERELKMSRTAYELAMQQINNYEKSKSTLENDISNLTTKNKNDEQHAFDYEKHIAILEYKRRLVALFGQNDKPANDLEKRTGNLIVTKICGINF